jgi:TPR repeat protein
MIRSLALLLTVTACGNSAGPAHPTNSAISTTLDDARAYERGRGVPRDYARAAEIYTALCNNGAGPLEACETMIDWFVDARGVSRDTDAMLSIMHGLCAHGDTVSCVNEALETAPVGGLLSDESTPPPPPDPVYEKGMAELRVSCAKHRDGRACEQVSYDIVGWDGRAEDARTRILALPCEQGRIESCARIIPQFERCEVEDDPARCEADSVRDWKTAHPVWYGAAQTLMRACAEGDALACMHVPSKRVPLATRCAAHDYEACGMLGCLGDSASGAIANKHGAEVNCQTAERLGVLEARAGTLPATAHVTGIVDDPM